MKTRSSRQQRVTGVRSLILVGLVILVAVVAAVPFHSVSSSSLRNDRTAKSSASLPTFPESKGLTERIVWPTSHHLVLPIVPQGGGESIATYEYPACTVPKNSFNLGETVCAVITGAPLPVDGRAARRIGWVSPYGSLAQGADITTDPQNGTYLIPTSQTQTFTDAGGGTVTVDNRGVWGVSIYSAADGSLRETAFFTVHDPAKAFVDLYISQAVTTDESNVGAGSSSVFEIFAKNFGPDTATDVVIRDTVPDNTTDQSITDHGAGFSCGAIDGGIITCTLASLPAGTESHLTLNYSVNTGTPAGTVLTNVVDISSSATPCAPDATCEIQPDDNTSTAQATVPAGAGGATCTLICSDNINAVADTTENGQRGTHVTFDAAEASGTCGAVTANPASGSFFPVGSTVVSVTSETGGGSCSFIVTVEDTGTNPPTISCPANQTANADSNCSATVNVGTATATGDNVTIFATRSDGQPMYSCDGNGNCTRLSSDAPFAAGVTTITWIAHSHDTPGPYASEDDEIAHRTGAASCTQTVTVNDVTPPTINAPNTSASADANCQAAVPDYSTIATVSDNCACASSDTSDTCQDRQRITVSQDVAPGTLVGLGPHTITLTANDGSSNNGGAGNTTTIQVTFTVNDTTAPVINCPASITTSNDPGLCSAVVNPGTATATDNCDSTPTIVGTRSDNQPLNAAYPKGTTIITWSATDDAGNTSSCNQSVTVNDTEPPSISCPSNITRGNDPGICGAVVTYTTPVGSDNCPGATTAQTAGLPSGSTFPVGTTTNTFEVTDASGNKTSCSFTVTVNDVENPVISCPASQALEPTCPSGAVATWTPPVGTDNCPGAVTTRTAGPAPGSVFPIGTTTVTYTVNDAHGHSASCSFTVTVKTVFQTIEDLKAAVNASSLSGTQKQGLISKLQAAEDALATGHTSTACQKLADFINSVQNYIDHGNVSAAVGNAWISTATHVRNAIGCTSNPCT